MKLPLSILLSLLFIIPALGQMPEKKYVGNRDAQGRKTGLWKTYIGNTLFETQVYKEGKETGAYVLYNIWNDDDETVVLEKGQYKDSKRVGEWVSYHPNGKVHEIGSYANSQRTGAWKDYYESGEPEAVMNYLNGQKSGEHKRLFQNGQIEREGNYLNDKKVGEWVYFQMNWSEGTRYTKRIENFNVQGDTVGKWVEYRDNDELELLKTYDQNGVLNGPYEENNYNGLVEKGNFVNGIRNGVWEFGNSDSNIWKEVIEFKNGKRDGIYEKKRSYNSNLAKGTYSNDLKVGEWEETESGGALGKGSYVANKRTGLWKFYGGRNNTLVAEIEYGTNEIQLVTRQYYEDGSLGKELSFNEADGSVSYNEYYPSAQVKITGLLRNNQQSGEWKEYYDNGKIARVSNYSDGQLNGDYAVYFPNDQLKMRASFEQGKLWNVSAMNDKDGNKLDSGTLKNGNGTLIEYDENGKLTKVLNFVNGQQQN